MIDSSRIDQLTDEQRQTLVDTYEPAVGHMWKFINEEVWPLIAVHGPVLASALLSMTKIVVATPDGDLDLSEGFVGLALVELALGQMP